MSSTSQRDREFLTEFIKYYRKLPAIWNTKCQEYRNSTLKMKSYLLLLNKYKENYPTANLRDVKKKINSLRSNYRRYYHKFGPNGPAGLYWFKDMNFIMGSEEVGGEIDVEASYLEVKCDPLDTDMSGNDSYKDEEGEEMEHYDIEDDTVKCEVSDEDSPEEICTEELVFENETPIKISTPTLRYEKATQRKPTVPLVYKKEPKTSPLIYKKEPKNSPLIYKKEGKPIKRIKKHKEQEESITLLHVEDEYDYWGKVMAAELKKMDPLQQVFAKKAITDVLLEGQLGLLTKHSVQINKSSET